MITLFDLGAEFWRNYHGMKKSALDAYSATYDRIHYYYRESGGKLTSAHGSRVSNFILCVDSPRSERKEKHPTYKASREKNAPDAIDALRSLIERIAENGIPVAQVDRWEGDDVIATLTDQAWPEEVEIIGSEKDFYCLISDTVTLIGKSGRVDSGACFEKFGVAPSQMTDFLAMVGDAADDIKGCPDCGPGRAAKLLERFGTLEAVRAAAIAGELLDPKGKGIIRGCGEATVASLIAWDPTQALELVRMRRDLPIDLEALLAGR